MKLTNIHMIIILVSAIIFSAIFGPDLLEGMSESQYTSQRALDAVKGANTGTKQDERYIKHHDHKKKRRKRRNRRKNKKHRKHLYSRDSLSEPTGMAGYKQDLVNKYNSQPYNSPVTYDSDSDYDSDSQSGDCLLYTSPSPRD